MGTPPLVRRVILLMVVLLIAACSGNGAVTTTPAAEAPAASVRTVIVLWHAWPVGEQQTLNNLVEQYNRLNSDTQVVLQSRPATSLVADMSTAIAEGGGPHIAIVPSHTLGGLAERGWIQPLDDLFASEDLSQLLPAAVGSTLVRDGVAEALYGIPITFDTLALYYNRANFASEPPSDLAALLEAARALTDTRSEPPVWGLAYQLDLERTIGYLYAFDGEVFSDSGDVALGLSGRAGAERWLAWLNEMDRDERILAGLDGITIDSMVMSGNVLMTIDWAHRLEYYQTVWQDQLGVAPLPRLLVEDRVPTPYVQSDALVMNARIASSSERAAVADFARYLIEPAAQQALLRASQQPVLLSLDLNDTALAPTEILAAARAFRQQGERGQPMPNNRTANEITRSVLIDMHANALRGLQTPEQAVSDADAALRAQLGTSTSAP